MDVDTVRFLSLLMLNQEHHINECWRGNTALHKASEKGNVEMANVLISCKANVEARNTSKLQTPLLLATTLQVVKLLVDNGANIHHRDSE